MLCGVLVPNLHVAELDDAEDFLTGVTLAGVTITQRAAEEDHSVTYGKAGPPNVPECQMRVFGTGVLGTFWGLGSGDSVLPCSG